MIKQFLMNLMLTFIWVALTGHLDYINFFFGFALGFFMLWLIERNRKNRDYFYRVPKIIHFILYFFIDMLRANWEVAKDVMTPNYKTTPGIVQYTMNANTDFEVTMLCNIISLTPGTLILDVSEDKKTVYIHVMYLRDKEKFITRMRNGTEKKLLEILR
jgi:multicomponent Na+:H+ antiporter subunit E